MKADCDCDEEHLQMSAELELQKAWRQLSSLQEQKEQMQRVHSSKRGEIDTLATSLFHQILELDDSIDAILASEALKVAFGGASEAPVVDMRSPRPFFQGTQGGVHEMRVLSPRGGWGSVGDFFLPEAHSAIPALQIQAPTRGMLVYLNMQMGEITCMLQFEREFLEEVALAANVRADDLKVFR